MTLSFSLNPRPSPTPTNPNPPNPNFIPEEVQEDDQQQVHEQEFITEFTPSPSPPPPPPHFTIPPIPNTWNPHPHPLSSPSVSGEEIMDSEAKLLKKLREDLAKLPDHSGAEEFRDVPVEGYGRAVLEGYGWCEGAGIGRNAKGDVQVKQYTGNVGRHGLGFVPKN